MNQWKGKVTKNKPISSGLIVTGKRNEKEIHRSFLFGKKVKNKMNLSNGKWRRNQFDKIELMESIDVCNFLE